jgi:hypothetical protein
MHAKNWPKLLGLVAFSFLILVQYQNCSPSRSQTQQDGTSIPDSQNIVHAMGSISFNEAEIQMPSTGTWATVSGTCDISTSDGSLNWQLIDPDTNLTIDAGSTACTNNQFSLEIAASSDIICQKTYQLHMQTGFEGSEDVSVNFVRACQ